MKFINEFKNFYEQKEVSTQEIEEKVFEGDFESVKSMLKNYSEFLDKRLKDLKQDKYSKLDYAKGQKAAFEDAKELLEKIIKTYS